MEAITPPYLLVSDAQRVEFRQSATELTAINVPSVIAGSISEIGNHSAIVAATTLMEASDIVFSLGVFWTEKWDRQNKHEKALRTRQGFAVGHIATAGAGVMLGVNDIAQGIEPSSGNLWVSTAVIGASALSLCLDRVREKRRTRADCGTLVQEQNHQEVFHGLNMEFVKDMKKTNIAEVGGGMLAVISQKYVGMDNGAALFTIAGSLGVIGIMARNFVRQGRVYKRLAHHITPNK